VPTPPFPFPDRAGRDPYDDDDLVSYRTLRRVVGVLGVSLPVVLAVWGFALEGRVEFLPSISDYYALRTRDVLVGVLFTIAWFLFTYRGYDRRDDIAGNLACVFALGVALFPNVGPWAAPTIHFVSAGLLFLVLAYFSLFLFTESAPSCTRGKVMRNRVYRTCGVAMLACIVGIALSKAFISRATLEHWPIVFTFETIALWAFGYSWFVKGDTVFRDASETVPARSENPA
jgi:hypothetical protein